MDWETWLRSAAEPPSATEDEKRQRTEEEVRAALAASDALRGRPYCVYAKGSYANNTNVRLNYDVDIAVEYNGYFYFDLMFDLDGATPADVGVTSPSSDPYSRAAFKADIRAALVAAFGDSAVEDGDIAYRVREKKTTLPADVVPSWEYRRYERIVNGIPVYQEGARVFPSTGGFKDNFPAVQKANGIAKNKATGLRYKRMVRALKKLQTKLVDEQVLNEELPSYLTECLVYNVPDSAFNQAAYTSDMRAVLATIFNATLASGDFNDWLQVNELMYLFRGSNGFPVSDVHSMAGAAWDAMGFE
jgi:hypothetical protein